MLLLNPAKTLVYCFPVEIIRAAEKEGIDLDTLNDMVKHSMRITHPQANRRHGEWLFMVEGHDILGFGKMEEGFQSTPRSSGYNVSAEVLEAAAKEGISAQTLKAMVKDSLPVSHEKGNRRYNGWLFNVDRGYVRTAIRTQDIGEPEVAEKKLDIEPLSSVDDELSFDACTSCGGSKKISAFDPCEKCDGGGCKYCDEGLVPRQIPCPVCV